MKKIQTETLSYREHFIPRLPIPLLRRRGTTNEYEELFVRENLPTPIPSLLFKEVGK
jgi:hypothetical protein